jgi:hypothetical protein
MLLRGRIRFGMGFVIQNAPVTGDDIFFDAVDFAREFEGANSCLL